MSLLVMVMVTLLGQVFGGVVLPRESVVRGGLTVSELHRGQDRKLGYEPYMKFGDKYDKYPSYHIASVGHDITQQLAMLERNLAAARPYLERNPEILHETEEQLRALQHIHADRLLRGMESIRLLEIQQEVLIHKVNTQLENSIRQLNRMAALQQEISDKQTVSTVPESTVEANRHLTAQLHAIEAAKQETAALEMAKDAIDQAIAQEDIPPRVSAVSSDAGFLLSNSPALDPRTTARLSDVIPQSPSGEQVKPIKFELGE